MRPPAPTRGPSWPSALLPALLLAGLLASAGAQATASTTDLPDEAPVVEMTVTGE